MVIRVHLLACGFHLSMTRPPPSRPSLELHVSDTPSPKPENNYSIIQFVLFVCSVMPRRNASKPLRLKDFNIPKGSWVQTAQERSKWQGLMNKGATLYENKRESVKLKESAENAI